MKGTAAGGQGTKWKRRSPSKNEFAKCAGGKGGEASSNVSAEKKEKWSPIVEKGEDSERKCGGQNRNHISHVHKLNKKAKRPKEDPGDASQYEGKKADNLLS